VVVAWGAIVLVLFPECCCHRCRYNVHQVFLCWWFEGSVGQCGPLIILYFNGHLVCHVGWGQLEWRQLELGQGEELVHLVVAVGIAP